MTNNFKCFVGILVGAPMSIHEMTHLQIKELESKNQMQRLN